jgi:SseB protein N-terminal domain
MSNIQPSGFAGDDGGADPDLVRALAEYDESTRAYPVLAALARARLLVPIVAMVGETEESDDGRVRDTSAEVAVVLFQRPDGRKALLAFTSVDAMRTWNPEARPRPLWIKDVARAAGDEGVDAVLIDLAGPVRFAVEADELRHLAAGHDLVSTAAGYAWLALPS